MRLGTILRSCASRLDLGGGGGGRWFLGEIDCGIIDEAVGAAVRAKRGNGRSRGGIPPRARRGRSMATQGGDEKATQNQCSHGVASLPFVPRVVRWRALRQPVAKRGRIVGQAPLLEDRQSHRSHATVMFAR